MKIFREEVTMARPTPSGKGTTPPKRTKIGTLDIIIVILGVVFIIGYNRLSIAKLQRSIPNANSQIVGEWKSTRGPEHLVFRADKSVSMIWPAPAQSNAAPAASPAEAPAPATPSASQTEAPAPAAPAPEAEAAAPAAPETAAPLVGKYQLSEAGKVFVDLSNGKRYSTIITPQSKNRFDLIDGYTDAVTTFERVPSETGATKEASPPP
jgi:hypothetical protein